MRQVSLDPRVAAIYRLENKCKHDGNLFELKTVRHLQWGLEYTRSEYIHDTDEPDVGIKVTVMYINDIL